MLDLVLEVGIRQLRRPVHIDEHDPRTRHCRTRTQELGYEGFAPDDADSSSIRFLVQEELEIQLMAAQPSTMLNGGSYHPPPS